MVAEVDEAVNHDIGLLEGSWPVAVDTFCLENGEEVLCHGVDITAAPP